MTSLHPDSRQIIQEKTRAALIVLRKSSRWLKTFSEGNTIITSLSSLRADLRNSNDNLATARIFAPFLALLRAPQLAGPFIFTALDSVHTFLNCNILAQDHPDTADTIGEIVDAVSRCKFVQTDVIGDDLVHMKIIQVFHDVVKSPYRYFLSDESAWSIIETCFNTLLYTAQSKVNSPLRQLTETSLMDTIRFVFTPEHMITSSSLINEAVNGSRGAMFGLPCGMKILGHFVKVIHRYAHLESADIANAKSNVAKASSTQANTGLDDSISNDGSNHHHPYRVRSWKNELQEAILALKCIQTIFWSNGNFQSFRDIIVSCPPMASLIKDDLGKSLILLAIRYQNSALMLQSILGLFSSLFVSLGPILKVFVESFFQHVYLKALHQLLAVLEKQNDPNVPIGSMPVAVAPAVDGKPASKNSYSSEELEIILESLIDLIAIPCFLPSMYCSFDSNPSKPDLIWSLFDYLSKCSSYSLLQTADESQPSINLGKYRNAAKMTAECLIQATSTIAARCDLSLHHSTPSVEIETFVSTQQPSQLPRAGATPAELISSQFHADFCSKQILREASAQFTESPKLGIKFLKSLQAVDNVITPESLAKFLRIAPGLAKEVVGSYLGEIGKEDPSYEAQGVEFHKQVLHHYVHTFKFDNQGFLNCIRIFLSAFHLPGEAQQIDRILMAFAEHCFINCIEGKAHILENSDVTYLLSFAIIMLNTDRHNPNVRADRKMTLEQFVKYNTNYGSDIKQTVSLPRDFLESLYESISECPLRTQKNDISSLFSDEVWMDLQLQTILNPESGLLVTTSFTKETLLSLTGCVMPTSEHAQFDMSQFVPLNPAKTTYQTLTNSEPRSVVDPVTLSSYIYDAHWIVDYAMVETVWIPILIASIRPFLRPELTGGEPAYFENSGNGNVHAKIVCASAKNIASGKHLIWLLLKISCKYKLQSVIDLITVLLIDFSGLTQGETTKGILKTFASYVSLPFNYKLRIASSNGTEVTPTSLSVAESPILQKKSNISDVISEHPISFQHIISTKYLWTLMNFHPANVALRMILAIGVHHPHYLGVIGWTSVWHVICLMRDFTALRHSMIHTECWGVSSTGENDNKDLLHAKAREDFEDRLSKARGKALHISREDFGDFIEEQFSKPSMLSFQGIGEVLFGSSSAANQSKINAALEVAIEQKKALEGIRSVMMGRWDSGYSKETNALSDLEFVYHESYPGQGDGGTAEVDHAWAQSLQRLGRQTVILLRTIMLEEGVDQIISDSKFLAEKSLTYFLQGLCNIAETESIVNIDETSSNEYSKKSKAVQESMTSPTAESIVDFFVTPGKRKSLSLDDMLAREIKSLSSPSEASTAWLEMVLVEVALRNRDRLSVIWPLLSSHYARSFAADLEKENFDPMILSYSTDRRVVGLFKIASRMLSRKQLCGPILHLLESLFGPNKDDTNDQENHKSTSVKESQPHVKDSLRESPVIISSPSSPTPSHSLDDPSSGEDIGDDVPNDDVLYEISGQVASGMWMMITQNVTVLPSLRLDQWQAIFDIISTAAMCGPYAAIKSFECMAWLVHEPRLRAEVPVFCVQAVKPLLINRHAPASVAVGAIHLLLHLHSRLEVLVQESPYEKNTTSTGVTIVNRADSNTSANGDDRETPALWESCWIPILKCLALGIIDKRPAVRRSAVDAMCCAILDSHSSAAPSSVLLSILHNIFLPSVSTLSQDFTKGVANSTWNVVKAEGSSYEINMDMNLNPSEHNDVISPDNKSLETIRAAVDNCSPNARNNSCVVATLLHSLSKVFLLNIHRLAILTDFEIFWKDLLASLVYFLDAPPPIGCGYNPALDSQSSELLYTVETTKEILKNLLQVVKSNGYFGNGNDNMLWLKTRQAVGNLQKCPNLLDDILPNISGASK